MMVDRFGGQEQPSGDFAVAKPLAEKLRNLDLASGKSRRIGPRRVVRTAGNSFDSQLTKTTPGMLRTRFCAEALEDL